MAGKLFVFSGAGLSAESGLSTFRDSNGLWNNFNLREVCHIDTWKFNKKAVFDFYNARRLQMNEVEPNPAHYAIAQLEKELGQDRVYNVTMNVDSLLEKAGCSDVIHVHGNITDMLCTFCNKTYNVGVTETSPNDKCPHCGNVGFVKPGVVFFGESAPLYRKMYQTFELPTKDDVVLIIGTSGTVVNPDQLLDFSVNSKKYLVCKDRPRMLVSNYTLKKGNAGEIVPALVPEILEYLG